MRSNRAVARGDRPSTQGTRASMAHARRAAHAAVASSAAEDARDHRRRETTACTTDGVTSATAARASKVRSRIRRASCDEWRFGAGAAGGAPPLASAMSSSRWFFVGWTTPLPLAPFLLPFWPGPVWPGFVDAYWIV